MSPMSPEQEPSVFTIEHWNYQMAMDAGHPEVAEMGMFVDVAVLRQKEEIVCARKIKELKIEWERFKRDEEYAREILQVAEALIEATA